MNHILLKVRKIMVSMGIIPIDLIQNDNEPNCCYICGKEIKSTDCSDCMVNFDDIFVCPFLEDTEHLKGNKICVLSKQKCGIKGIEFESCDSYHSVNL